MKRAKFLQYLRRHGCKLIREGAKHSIYGASDGLHKSVVPRHSEIKPITIRNICKDLQIEPPDEK